MVYQYILWSILWGWCRKIAANSRWAKQLSTTIHATFSWFAVGQNFNVYSKPAMDKNTTKSQLIFSLDQAAAFLGIKPQTLRNWRSQGKPCPNSFSYPESNKVLFHLDDLLQFISDARAILRTIAPNDLPVKRRKKSKADIVREQREGLKIANSK